MGAQYWETADLRQKLVIWRRPQGTGAIKNFSKLRFDVILEKAEPEGKRISAEEVFLQPR